MELTINDARNYLAAVMGTDFKDKTFHGYIGVSLAGDFAVEIATFMKRLETRLAAAEQELAEAKAGWEAADTQIGIEAGDVMRLTKERDELLNKIQWYADYANDTDKSVTREMERANVAEKERDELRAENEILKGELAVKCADCNRHDAFERLGELTADNERLAAEVARLERELHSRTVGNQDAHAVISRQAAMLADHRTQLVATKAENERLAREVKEREDNLLNLLAIIHRDGGQHTEKVGLLQSLMDGIAKSCERIQAESDLTAAQQSAKEQFGLGLEPGASDTNGTPFSVPTSDSEIIAYLRARLAAAEQEISGLRAELSDDTVPLFDQNRMLEEQLDYWRAAAEVNQYDKEVAEKERDELRADRDRLAGEVERLKGTPKGFAINSLCKRIEALQEDLTAAQSTAKEQFRAGWKDGMESAAKICDSRGNSTGCGLVDYAASAIRAAANEQGGEGE